MTGGLSLTPPDGASARCTRGGVGAETTSGACPGAAGCRTGRASTAGPASCAGRRWRTTGRARTRGGSTGCGTVRIGRGLTAGLSALATTAGRGDPTVEGAETTRGASTLIRGGDNCGGSVVTAWLLATTGTDAATADTATPSGNATTSPTRPRKGDEGVRSGDVRTAIRGACPVTSGGAPGGAACRGERMASPAAASSDRETSTSCGRRQRATFTRWGVSGAVVTRGGVTLTSPGGS